MLLVVGIVTGSARIVADDGAPASIAARIDELGAATYERREKALDALVAMGTSAIPSLEDAARSPDLEIASRCRRAIERIRMTEFERRLVEYAAGTAPAYDPLPGQARFETLCGAAAPDREFFVKVLLAERELAVRRIRRPAGFAEALAARFEVVLLHTNSRTPLRTGPTAESIAALLLYVTDPDLDVPSELFDHHGWTILVNQPHFQDALSGSQGDGPRMRALLGEWILSPSSSVNVAAKAKLALEQGLAEGIAFAERYSRDEELPSRHRPIAMQTLAVLGGKEHAARLLPLLDDRTACQTRIHRGPDGGVQRLPIEIRDVALGWLLFITEQKPGDYGFVQLDEVFARTRETPDLVGAASSFYFADDASRDRGFAKWTAWSAAHPLPVPPELSYVAR